MSRGFRDERLSAKAQTQDPLRSSSPGTYSMSGMSTDFQEPHGQSQSAFENSARAGSSLAESPQRLRDLAVLGYGLRLIDRIESRLKQQTVEERKFPSDSKASYAGQTLEPHGSPVPQEQLAAEIQAIYRSLFRIEAECMKIQAVIADDDDDLDSQLRPAQWESFVRLHHYLLEEHYDFLLATQHPSANLAMRILPTKYSMLARMWKHGIRNFLEVLLYKLPQSQEHMLAFTYLVYQMMELFLETVPSFTDTWIVYLNDLAEYRLVLEAEYIRGIQKELVFRKSVVHHRTPNTLDNLLESIELQDMTIGGQRKLAKFDQRELDLEPAITNEPTRNFDLTIIILQKIFAHAVLSQSSRGIG